MAGHRSFSTLRHKRDDAISLGSGLLNWAAQERRSDRYGTVRLLNEDDDVILSLDGAPLGQRGTLSAHVIERRPADHIGDIFRGIYPDPAEAGTHLILGTGTLFADDSDEFGISVGVRPDDGRGADWLDPRALYRGHNQRVELLFTPER
jgi:hypothetical protein